MKKEQRCSRCGTLLDVKKYKKKYMIQCPHCNLKMTVSKSSDVKIWIVKIFFYIVVSAIILFIINTVPIFKDVQSSTFKYFGLLIAVGALTICAAIVIEGLATNIVNSLFGLDYIKYEEKKDVKNKKGKKK